MQTRPLLLMGLALASGAGCQSYFPYSQGGAGPYPAMPPGTYTAPPGSYPQGSVSSPPATTYQPSAPPKSMTTETPSIKQPPAAPSRTKPVPDYPDSGSAPATLGAPDDEDETIRRPTSRLDSAPGQPDEGSGETLAAFGQEEFAPSNGQDDFAPPRKVQSAAAIDDGDEIPRHARKPAPSPYKYDSQGYTYLRGTVSRDPESGDWRLRYSNDPLDGDRYGGVLTIVGNEKIEQLIEEEPILVRGEIDPSATDQHGKPTYRVRSLQWITPKAR